MTPENAALGIGAFLILVGLIVMTRIWRRVRLMEARLSKTQEEIKEFHALYGRLFMTVMNAKPKVEADHLAAPQNAQNAGAKFNGGERQKSLAEATSLVPPSHPVES